MSENQAPFPRLRAAYLRSIAEGLERPQVPRSFLVAESNNNPRGVLPCSRSAMASSFPSTSRSRSSDKKRPMYRPIGTTGWFGLGMSSRSTCQERGCRRLPSRGRGAGSLLR